MLDRPIKGRAVRDACELYLGQSDALPICTAYIKRTRVTTTYKRSWRTLWLVRKPDVVSVNTSKRTHPHPFLSPDGLMAFFNSDVSGVLQAYMIRGLDGVG